MASLDPNNNNSSSSHQGPFQNPVDHPSLPSPNPASCFPVLEFNAAHQLGVQRPWPNSTAHMEKPIKISPNPSFVYADGSRLLPAFASMDAYGNPVRTFVDSPELGGMNWDGKLPYMFPASHSSSNLLVGNPLGHAVLHDGSSLRDVAAMRPAVSNDKGIVASGVGSFLVGSSPPLSDMEKLLNSSWGSLNSSGAPVDPSEGGLPLQAMNLPSSACLANFSTDPGFVERAAKFSSFNNHGYPELAQSSVGDGGRAVNRLVVASQAKLTRVSSGDNTPRCSAPSSPVACAGATEANNGMPEMIHRHSAHVQEASGAVLLEDPKVNLEKKISCSPSQVDGGDGVQKRCISVNESDESMGQEVSSSCERNGGSCEIASQGMNGNSGQKRRAISKDRSSKPVAAAAAATVKDSENDEGKSKRSKSGDGANGEGSKPKVEQSQSGNSDDSTPKSVKENSKPPEAPKPDYIHVRARRGQATDSHSLAERVRREKISERMKFLQDLVPGCSKVTGKAVMLDEIINYVQSLQRQVEFLSMKLAAVNPRLDFNIESLFAREMMQPRASSQTLVFAPENTNSNTNSYPPAHQQQSQALLQVGGSCAPIDVHSLASDPTVRSINNPLTPMDAYGDSVSQQVSQAWDNELQSIVQMGFAQGRQTPLSSPNVQGQLYPGQMKVEL